MSEVDKVVDGLVRQWIVTLATLSTLNESTIAIIGAWLADRDAELEAANVALSLHVARESENHIRFGTVLVVRDDVIGGPENRPIVEPDEAAEDRTQDFEPHSDGAPALPVCANCLKPFLPGPHTKKAKYCGLTCSGQAAQKRMALAREGKRLTDVGIAAQEASELMASEARNGAASSAISARITTPSKVPPETPGCAFKAGDTVRAIQDCESLGGAPIRKHMAGVVDHITPHGVPHVKFEDRKVSVRAEFLEMA